MRSVAESIAPAIPRIAGFRASIAPSIPQVIPLLTGQEENVRSSAVNSLAKLSDQGKISNFPTWRHS